MEMCSTSAVAAAFHFQHVIEWWNAGPASLHSMTWVLWLLSKSRFKTEKPIAHGITCLRRTADAVERCRCDFFVSSLNSPPMTFSKIDLGPLWIVFMTFTRFCDFMLVLVIAKHWLFLWKIIWSRVVCSENRKWHNILSRFLTRQWQRVSRQPLARVGTRWMVQYNQYNAV